MFHTQRLILRPIEQGDADWFVKIYGNPVIMRDIYDGSTFSQEKSTDRVNQFLHHWQEHGFGVWMVIEKESLSIAGYCVFRFFEDSNSPLNKQVELGYIFDQPFWGKGYASEAVPACIKIGFENHHFDRIIATVLPQNIVSQKIVLKAGMQRIADLPVKGLLHYIYEIIL